MELIKNTLTSPFQRMNYYECQKGNSHEGQKLNFVCINKQCSQIGLICSICRSQHQEHDEDVIPLKMLLDKLRNKKENSNNNEKQLSCPIQNYMQALQNTKCKLLYELKTTVQKMASYFMKLQEQILQSFQSIKLSLLEEVGMNLGLDMVIEQALKGRNKNLSQFEQNIKIIAKTVEPIDKKRDFVLRNNPQAIVDKYEDQYNFTFQKLNQIARNTQEILSKKIQQKTINTKIKKHKNKINEDSVFGNMFDSNSQQQDHFSSNKVENLKKCKYTFSTYMKGNSILVQKNGLMAKQTNSGSVTRFITVNEGLGQKNQKISFRIVNLVNWIGIGICIRDIISKEKYHFKYQQLGHGSYLVSSNGYTWSHSSSDDNIKQKNFSFGKGQIIDVFLNPNQLKFVKRIQKEQLKLKISIKPNEWNSVCFCANLCSGEDKIQIINE